MPKMSKCRNLLALSALVSLGAAGSGMAQQLGLGRLALPEEIAAWDVAVMPNGHGLPEGRGSVYDGEELWIEHCAACHGDFGEAVGNWPVIAGGLGTLRAERPVKTVGSYWPYLSTVFDYVHRSMPFGNAQSLDADQTYAITAYILYSNNLVDDDFELNHENFTEVVLPNAEGFYVDDRAEVELPLFSQERCMADCRAPVSISARATDMNVTPPFEPIRLDTPAPAVAAAQSAPVPEPAPEQVAAAPAHDPALVAEGERAWRQCATCHRVGEGARNGTGPMLNDILGRTAGTIEGFRYSPPMRAAGDGGLVWDAQTLDAFLENPAGYIPRNRMSFRGVRSAEERAALVAYLSTFSD